MNRHCGQEWWSTARFTIRAGAFYQVELRGLEPLTPCLQIAVITQQPRRELADMRRRYTGSQATTAATLRFLDALLLTPSDPPAHT